MDAASPRRGAGEARLKRAVEAERVRTGSTTDHRLHTGVATRARPRGHQRADLSTTLSTGAVTPGGGSRVRSAGVAVGVALGSGLSCSFPTIMHTHRTHGSSDDTPRWRWLDDPDVAGEGPARWLGREQYIIETIIRSIRPFESCRERIANWRFMLERVDAPVWIDDCLREQETRLRAHARQAVVCEIYHAAPERRREIRERLVDSDRPTPRAAIVLVDVLSDTTTHTCKSANTNAQCSSQDEGTGSSPSGRECMSEAMNGTPRALSTLNWNNITAGQVEAIAPSCSVSKLHAHLAAARDADAVAPGVVDALAATSSRAASLTRSSTTERPSS